MPTKSLITKEDRAIHYNAPNAPRFRAGGPLSLSKKPLASYKRHELGRVSENLVALWEIVKNDSQAYRKIERERESMPGRESGREWSVVQMSFTEVLAGCVTRHVQVGILFFKEFSRFPKEQKRTSPRMGLMVCTNLFRTAADDSFGRVRFARKKGTIFSEKPTDPIPKSHLQIRLCVPEIRRNNRRTLS